MGVIIQMIMTLANYRFIDNAYIMHKRTKSRLKLILIALPISFIGLRVKMDFKGYFVRFFNLRANMLKKIEIFNIFDENVKKNQKFI